MQQFIGKQGATEGTMVTSAGHLLPHASCKEIGIIDLSHLVHRNRSCHTTVLALHGTIPKTLKGIRLHRNITLHDKQCCVLLQTEFPLTL